MENAPLVVHSRLRIPRAEFTLSFVRSSGPGGQNVNKVASKAQLRWDVLGSPSLPAEVRERFRARYGSRLTTSGELILSSQRYRDQGRNVADCLEKLRAMLVAVSRPPVKRRPTRPSRAARQRRLEEKRSVARTKRLRRKPEEE